MPVRTCAREPPRRRHTRAAKHWRSCERWARTRSLARGRRNLPRHFALSPDASSTVPVSRSGFASLQRCMWRMCCMCWQCAPTATAPRRVGCEGTQCSARRGARHCAAVAEQRTPEAEAATGLLAHKGMTRGRGGVALLLPVPPRSYKVPPPAPRPRGQNPPRQQLGPRAPATCRHRGTQG